MFSGECAEVVELHLYQRVAMWRPLVLAEPRQQQIDLFDIHVHVLAARGHAGQRVGRVGTEAVGDNQAQLVDHAQPRLLQIVQAHQQRQVWCFICRFHGFNQGV